MPYTVGSLVRARGREWVVLPDSTAEWLVLRPLGGTDLAVAGLYIPLEVCHTRPDFLYTEARVAIYIDGPDHDQSDIKAKDTQITDCLMNNGYTIVRFGYRKDAWVGIGAQHRYLFGNDQLWQIGGL